jgi:ribosomal protein S18 acetylase RimI-like enzyme
MPYAPPAHSETEDLEWARELLLPARGVTIAEVENVVVGVLAVRPSNDAQWIDQLYVLPSHFNRGIGSQLLDFALKTLGRPIRLYTFQQNGRARAFYEKRGFRPVAFGDGTRNEEQCPDGLYERTN